MSLKELYRDDLLNKFASHTFTETTVGSMTKVEFKDGGSAVVGVAQKLVVDDAYKEIREDLVGTVAEVMFSLTATQRDALTGTDAATLIFQETAEDIECYNGAEWAVVGATAWQLRSAATVQTTDATATVVDSFTLDDDETYMVQINVVGTKADGSDRCGAIKQAILYRNGGGATIQGVVSVTLEEYSDSNWDIDITASGNDVRASVTGLAVTTVNWKCSMQFIEQ